MLTGCDYKSMELDCLFLQIKMFLGPRCYCKTQKTKHQYSNGHGKIEE